jgi:tetratricopeptide (TPR) repeat protein
MGIEADLAALIKSGEALRDKGDLDGALADLNRALEKDPKSRDALYFRGSVRKGKKDYDGAIHDYTQAIEIGPVWAGVYVNRANSHHAKGDLDGAIADYTKAIELGPAEGYMYRGRGIMKHAKPDLPGAIADYTKALEVDPKDALSHVNRGMAKNSAGDLEGAIRDCSAGLELDPKNADGFRIRGTASHNRGDLRGAMADYLRTLEFEPGNTSVIAALARARREAGIFCDDCRRETAGGNSSGNVSNLNGLGRTFYGEDRPCAACGSVVQTLWIIFLHVPLIPLGTYRVLRANFRREVTGTKESLTALSIAFSWSQVLMTWLVGLLSVAAFAGVIVGIVIWARYGK